MKVSASPTPTRRTNVAGIYAVGDVTGRAPLTPVAIAAGGACATGCSAASKDRNLDYELIPHRVFTHPPVGTVGLTEEQAPASARRRGQDLRRQFVPMYYALTARKRAPK